MQLFMQLFMLPFLVGERPVVGSIEEPSDVRFRVLYVHRRPARARLEDGGSVVVR